jgi:carbamoyl-phosphate synthase large subunit
MKVLVAGLAGASLGTEIVKCLSYVNKYEIYGCDISPLAYGLHSINLKNVFLVDISCYISSIIKICNTNQIKYVIPGGEQPMVLLSKAENDLLNHGITLVCNSKRVVGLFSSKEQTFSFLRERCFSIPMTVSLIDKDYSKLDVFSYPCIVKPSSGTGGSDSVFLATTKEECILYIELLLRNNRDALVQEYIDLENGEYTIGVLSNTKGEVISSVAMQRSFNSKLSVAYRGKKGLISSGYSQGLIDDFHDLRKQAEAIAIASGSTGPLNIQGRVKNGLLVPFEINPRFSASTYLRCIAGVNEIDLYLQHLVGNDFKSIPQVRKGYYMRSFEEKFIDTNFKINEF